MLSPSIKNRARLLYLACLLLACCLLANLAIADDLKVKVTSAFIDMHTGPGRGYPRFHSLEKGETITLLKSKTSWIKAVTEKGITGWINRGDMDNTIGLNGEAVLLGLPDKEDYANRRWEMGFGAGQFEKIPSLGIYGAYRFTNNLGLELRLNQATGNFSKNEIASVGLVHQIFPQNRFSPFFTLATGVISTSGKSQSVAVEDSTDEVFIIGTGAYYYLYNRFMLRLELNQYTSLPSENFNNEVSEIKLDLGTFF